MTKKRQGKEREEKEKVLLMGAVAGRFRAPVLMGAKKKDLAN